MIIVLEPGTTEKQIGAVLSELEQLGMRGRVLASAEKPLVHVTTSRTRRARTLLRMRRVEGLVPTSGPRVRSRGRRFYPYHLIGLGALSLVLIGVLVTLAGFFPPGLGATIDPVNPPERPSAYLPLLTGFLGLFPAALTWLAWPVLVLLLALVMGLPWLDRTRGNRLRDRWPAVVVALLGMAGLIALALQREVWR